MEEKFFSSNLRHRLTSELKEQAPQIVGKTKAHAPDPERVAYLEENLGLESPSPFFYPKQYRKIDTANKTPAQTAKEIIALL